MSDLARLSEIVRLALDGPISITPDAQVFRTVAVDGADEEVPLTKGQRAALQRALDPRRQGIVVNVQIHGGHGWPGDGPVNQAAAGGYRSGFEAGMAHAREEAARGHGRPGWQGGLR